ncbi:interferon alpha/beta receptor 2-like [Pholidichthys leucotaenia]
MTPLIWILSWLPVVLPAVSDLPAPVHLTIIYRDFSYILRWEPGPGTPAEVHYSVAYSPNRSMPWFPVEGCERRLQHPLTCNLTEAFLDLKKTYLVRVVAQLEGQRPEEAIVEDFKPITYLHLPSLSVFPCDRNLCVDLQPALERLKETYNVLQYRLQINSTNGDQKLQSQFRDIWSLKREVLENLDPGTEYCVSVQFFDSLEDMYSAFGPAQCAVAPHNFPADPVIAGVLCSLVVLVVVFLVLLVYGGFFCMRRRPLPSVLTSVHHLEDVAVLPPYSSSSSLLSVRPTAPLAGQKRPPSSDESSEEEEDSGSSGGGAAYTEGMGASLLSSSSAVFPRPKQELSVSSNLPSDISLHQYDSRRRTAGGDKSDGGLKETQRTGGGTIKEEDEDHEEEVNLLTLTFGRTEQREDQEEELEKSAPPAQTAEVVMEMGKDEEEEEEEMSAYLGRPNTD